MVVVVGGEGDGRIVRGRGSEGKQGGVERYTGDSPTGRINMQGE